MAKVPEHFTDTLKISKAQAEFCEFLGRKRTKRRLAKMVPVIGLSPSQRLKAALRRIHSRKEQTETKKLRLALNRIHALRH